ncbi:MAG: DNA topoisomerase I [Thermoleophilia bacterium]|nr:DNA topoisomerase I [Thermoleophilia bacterium]
MKLIVTEKDTAARKIASILGEGKVSTGSYQRVPIYSFSMNGDEFACIGLKGHIMQLEYPEEYSDWRKVEPKALIDASLIKAPAAKSVINALKKAAKDAEKVIIATDFDREGELIGLEALELVTEANPELARDAVRARYSALTSEEIHEAFANTVELSVPLAKAGAARQDIDLIWGATLTRFMSLATSRLGNQFLSVGRVQSPTLALIVERELERRAFVPEPYWQVFADVDSSQGGFTVQHKTDRFSRQAEAESASGNAAAAETGKVTGVKSTRKKTPPPQPFNTTAYTKAATALGFSAARAIRLAEDLYLGGFISYPRTDNTVYPASLNLREILVELRKSGELKAAADELLARESLTPTRGKKQTTDHPPIYPVGVPGSGDKLDEAHWKIWFLVARRFLATLGDEAVSENNRVEIGIGGEPFLVRGSRVTREGWLAWYPYARGKDVEVPRLKEGEEVKVIKVYDQHKETQPPGRYGQGRLIELMEQNGLGTKATRHSIIQSLYDRGYIKNTPVEPTETGIAMTKALNSYADRISKPEMTAELEQEMSAIAEEAMTKEEVVQRSRKLLHEAYSSLEENKEALAGVIVKGIQEDKNMGPCPKCGQQLRVIRSKKTKKRFVGCEGYPECSATYPLPQAGSVIAMGKECPECGSPKVKIITRGRRPWELCLDPGCPTKEEYKSRARKKRAAS